MVEVLYQLLWILDWLGIVVLRILLLLRVGSRAKSISLTTLLMILIVLTVGVSSVPLRLLSILSLVIALVIWDLALKTTKVLILSSLI